MKRIFYLLSLLALLVVGGGSKANAQEAVYKTLTFSTGTAEKNVQDYTSTWTNTVDGDTWTLDKFNNNNIKTNDKPWNFVRCGSKKTASIATIVNNDPYPELITKVVVTYDAVKNVNTTYLEVASDAKFTNAQKVEVKAH